ncbi:MAG TPA: TOBE domain-containing protein, partial [Acetobacteraceae bacterium]
MREELKRLQRELGMTFVHVTHSQEEAMALSDLMVVMEAGRIMQAASPREVFERPANAFAARFIGGHNVLPDGAGLVALRTDKCRLQPLPQQGASLAGRVAAVEYQGAMVRVALARALMTNPRVLLLDEPLSALDPELRIRMREELKRLQRDLGMTFVHVTHSQEEAMALSDLMVVMEAGRIVQAAPPREVFERPATAFVARFIGGHNVLPGPHGAVAVRADKCRIGGQPNDGGHVTGPVLAVEYLGAAVRVVIRLGDADEAVALMPDAEFHAAPIAIGDRAALGWSACDAHAIA